MYPTYTAVTNNEANDAESVYEERDLGQMYDAVGAPQHAYAAHDGRFAGPSFPPPRSSYGSPRPQNVRRTQLEVGQIYMPGRPSAPSSAPSAYPPYHHGNVYYPSTDHIPGAYPPAGPYSEPAMDDYYWYAGAPGSVAASSVPAYGERQISSRASAPAGMYDGSSDIPPGMFGVRAPHHHPAHRYSAPHQVEHLPNFPQWSRAWYDGHHSANGHAYTYAVPPSGETGWESADTMTRSGGYGASPYGVGHRGGNVDVVKQERIRMLEKQFGRPKISHNGGEAGDDDDAHTERDRYDDAMDDADLPLGSVTSTGTLVVERPRWRMALRWLIGVAAIACVGTGIGGALLIKPGSQAPAARGSIASYVIYGCSVITLVLVLYLHVFRRCCCDPMRKEMKMSGNGDNPLAGMIIPVLSAGTPSGGKGGKAFGFGKRGRKAMMMQQQQAPTVNLIVDPALLGGGRKSRGKGDAGYDDDDDDQYDERLPGDARRSSRRKNGVGVLGNIQLQRRWMMARKALKLIAIWDAVLCVAWIAASVVALGMGKACPAGAGNGWCNYYNGAISCGVILAVLFLAALYFDYRDLQVSKKAPKPPM